MNTKTTIYTGRRKASVARIRLVKGTGNVIVNETSFEKYFPREAHRIAATEPLTATNNLKKYDMLVNVFGGGSTGQAGAIRLAVARALKDENDKNKPILKKAGMLTRDAREVERKKYGLSGARKRYQFSKR